MIITVSKERGLVPLSFFTINKKKEVVICELC
nr:MAG TPA: hypothetical protein [Caudoviricetes sp.]